MTESQQGTGDDIAQVVGLVLRARQGSDRSSRALVAEVARAIRPQTEHYAAPHILPRLDPSSENRRSGVFRGAALIAQYPRIPQLPRSEEPPALAEHAPAEHALSEDAPAEHAADAAPQTARRSRGGRLGRSLKSLAAASENREAEIRSIGAKLQLLPTLDREQAVRIIDGLLARLDGTGIPVDFYDLVRTLAYWETTQPENDRALRQRIVFDFFS